MFNAGEGTGSELWLAKADGSGERQVDVRA